MAKNPKYTDMGWPELDALWTYDSLSEPLLTSELARLAATTSFGKTDCVSFQPCPDPGERNQDRYVVLDWNLRNGSWKFCGVFDGHAGHDTVDYVLKLIPGIVKAALADAVNSTVEPSITTISNILVESISSLDDTITKDLLHLFPDPESITQLSDEEISIIVNDESSGGVNAEIISRCMRGSTVLISLIDPAKSNLWVASLGDCQAVLGTRDSAGCWTSSVLSSYHNGANQAEKDRIRREHPGEAECVLDDRILGAIAVTRAVGDHLFKLPTIYTKRIFMKTRPGFLITKKVEDFLERNLTPPYVSTQADVRHVKINATETTGLRLVMCSDGLLDLYEEQGLELDGIAELWVQVLARSLPDDNLALALLRDAIGGQDEEKVSRMMTVEMCFRWMDDTTIVVQKVL